MHKNKGWSKTIPLIIQPLKQISFSHIHIFHLSKIEVWLIA